jgi:hypothetical protein
VAWFGQENHWGVLAWVLINVMKIGSAKLYALFNVNHIRKYMLEFEIEF